MMRLGISTCQPGKLGGCSFGFIGIGDSLAPLVPNSALQLPSVSINARQEQRQPVGQWTTCSLLASGQLSYHRAHEQHFQWPEVSVVVAVAAVVVVKLLPLACPLAHLPAAVSASEWQRRVLLLFPVAEKLTGDVVAPFQAT